MKATCHATLSKHVGYPTAMFSILVYMYCALTSCVKSLFQQLCTLKALQESSVIQYVSGRVPRSGPNTVRFQPTSKKSDKRDTTDWLSGSLLHRVLRLVYSNTQILVVGIGNMCLCLVVACTSLKEDGFLYRYALSSLSLVSVHTSDRCDPSRKKKKLSSRPCSRRKGGFHAVKETSTGERACSHLP